MKRFLILCVLCVLCGSAFGANEIRSFEAGATTCYAVVREIDGDVFYVTGLVFEVWGTGGRTAADYDIALTNKTGGLFVGNFDTNIAAGSYYVVTHMQAGGAPANTDPAVWEDYGYWSGSTWTTSATATPPAIADAVWDEPMAGHTGETTFGGELQTLDPNITAILGDTNELQTDWTNGGRLDLIVDAIKAMTDLIAVNVTTIASATDANEFVLTAGKDANDAYAYMAIMVEDASDSHAEVRWIEEYLVGRSVLVDEPFSFTPLAGDRAWILGPVYGGLLADILHRVNLSSIPIYHFTDGSGGTDGQGGITVFGADGSDP